MLIFWVVVLFWTLSLHKISPALSLPWFIAVSYLFTMDFLRERSLIPRGGSQIYLIWLTYCFYIVCYVIYELPAGGSWQFVFRATLIPFFGLFLISHGDVGRKFELTCLSSVGFAILCSLSIFYQYLFGPVSIFAPDSVRAGFPRYSTFAGNLNAFGIGVGFSLISITQISRLFHKPKMAVFLFWLIAMGALLTFSKAALMNVFIAFFIVSIFFGLRFVAWSVVLLTSIFSLVLLAHPSTIDQLMVFFQGVLGIEVGASHSAIIDYKSGWYDVLFRLGEIPRDFGESVNNTLFGVGLSAFGSSVGLEGNFLHNDYGNILGAFGIIGLFVYAILLAPLFIGGFGVSSIVLLVVNLTFSSGLMFHFYEGFIFIQLLLYRCALHAREGRLSPEI